MPAAQPRGRRRLYWVLAFILSTLGLGWSGTQMFASSLVDSVTPAERSQRALLVQDLKPLAVTPVPSQELDEALRTMKLEPAEQSALKTLLQAPVRAAPQPTAPATPLKAAATPLVPSAAVVAARPPLRLVELALWDTHAADGDIVVVASAGYSRQVVLGKQAETIFVPVSAGGGVSITGLRDGGGGITLGVRGAAQPLLMPILSEGQTLVLPLAP